MITETEYEAKESKAPEKQDLEKILDNSLDPDLAESVKKYGLDLSVALNIQVIRELKKLNAK